MKQWYLLPPDGRAIVIKSTRDALLQAGQTLTDVLHTVQQLRIYRTPFPESSFTRTFAHLLSKNNPFAPPSKEHIEAICEAIRLNMRFRVAMRTFLARWIAKKRLRPANDEDLVTLEPPKKPVHIIDWPGRRVYTFEARTIYKDCIERLLLHDELWENPSAPRNPYTNLPLTLGQVLGTVTQLRAHGYSHWTLDALYRCQYDLDTFKRKYADPLKYATIDAVFRDPNSEDCKQVLMDFLVQEFDEHEVLFQRTLYTWAMKHMNDSEHLVAWRKACKKSHELTVQYKDQDARNAQFAAQIDPVTAALTCPNNVLIAARRIWLTAQQNMRQQAAQQASASTAVRVRVSIFSPGYPFGLSAS